MLEINDAEFEAFMHAIGADSSAVPAASPRATESRRRPNTRRPMGRIVSIADRTFSLPGLSVLSPARVPGERWYGITRAEIVDLVTRSYGSPAAGHVTAPIDLPGFGVVRGEVIPVSTYMPQSLAVHDVVLFGAAANGYDEIEMYCGLAEVRQVRKRDVGVVCCAGNALSKCLGIACSRGSFKKTGERFFVMAFPTGTIPDDVRTEGHILAVLNLAARDMRERHLS